MIFDSMPSAAVCTATLCSYTPAKTLTDGAYKFRVRAYVSSAWLPYSSYMAFTVKAVPTLSSPKGTIKVTLPTYKWLPIKNATKYNVQVMTGTSTVINATVSSSVCTSTLCSYKPATTLGYKAYKWRVRSYVGTVWNPFSAYAAFTVSR